MNAQLEKMIEERDEIALRIEEIKAEIEDLEEELKELEVDHEDIERDIFHYENSPYENRKYEKGLT